MQMQQQIQEQLQEQQQQQNSPWTNSFTSINDVSSSEEEIINQLN